jgi:DNA-directed RNA polymerase subunit E'
MFKILTVQDDVRVKPKYFNNDTEDAIRESLKEQIEGKLDPEIGVFLAVTKILEYGEGMIKPEDPSVHYPATFEILTFVPEDQEVVYGTVVDIAEFGAFVRVGPLDGLVHTSQIMGDRVTYDQKNAILTGKKTRKKLEEGEIVRARIVSISLGKARTKIGLTMRQPLLGSMGWIEQDKKRAKIGKKSEDREEKPRASKGKR